MLALLRTAAAAAVAVLQARVQLAALQVQKQLAERQRDEAEAAVAELEAQLEEIGAEIADHMAEAEAEQQRAKSMTSASGGAGAAAGSLAAGSPSRGGSVSKTGAGGNRESIYRGLVIGWSCSKLHMHVLGTRGCSLHPEDAIDNSMALTAGTELASCCKAVLAAMAWQQRGRTVWRLICDVQRGCLLPPLWLLPAVLLPCYSSEGQQDGEDLIKAA